MAPLVAPQLAAAGANTAVVATRRASAEGLRDRRPVSARPRAPVLFPPPFQRRHPHPAGHLLLASFGPRTERAVAAVGSAECASRSSDRAIPGLALPPQAHFLPAYAPDLNPIEYAWCYLKMNPLANSPHFDLPALTHTTRRQARSPQRKPDLLGSLLSHSPLFCSHDRTLLIQD